MSTLDVSKMQTGDALTVLLKHAQADHRICVQKALASKEDVVEKCSLTWGEAHMRWRQFAAYRAPFKDEEAEGKYTGHWTRKRIDYDDNKLF